MKLTLELELKQELLFVRRAGLEQLALMRDALTYLPLPSIHKKASSKGEYLRDNLSSLLISI